MRVLLSCLLLIFIAAAARADAFVLSYQPSTIKITTPQKGIIAAPQPFYKGWPMLRAARGEWESFQIIITARKVLLKDVHIEPRSFENPLGAPILKNSWMIFRENYVQIPHPSARNSPPNLWWPDALIPQHLQSKITIEPGKSEVFWLTVRVPQNAEAGNYLGRLDVWANGEKQTVYVPLHVEPFAIPAPTMRANVAVYYDVLRDWYTKNIGAMSDAQFAKLKKEYYDFLLRYRINAYDLPVPWDSPEAAQYINNPKVLSVRLPPLSQKKELETAINVLKKNHAMSKGYYYWIDEPSPDRYPEIINTEKQLHTIDPAIKQCVTIAPNKTLDDSVDIWCPNIGDFLGLGHLDFSALASQRKKGRETWWYTMVIPKYPYPTWLVDDDALSVRRYGGLMARHGISGFVYSMAHGWGPDPLHNIASFAGTYGDGTLVYPADLVGGHGPMPSIRLMVLHDAIEDYELMKMQFRAEDYSFGWQIQFPAWDSDAPLQFFYQMYDPNIDSQINTRFFKAIRDACYLLYQDKYYTPHPERLEIQGDINSFPIYAIPDYDDKDLPRGGLKIDNESSNAPRDDNDIPISHGAEVGTVWADSSNLHVSLHAPYSSDLNADWLAVEIAVTDEGTYPMNYRRRYQWESYSTSNVIRWRFIVTRKGKALLEKQTKNGRVLVDDVDWQHKFKLYTNTYGQERVDYYAANFIIPRSLWNNAMKSSSPIAKKTLRINFLRHSQEIGKAGVTWRWHPDANDVYLMPPVKIVPVGVKEVPHPTNR